MFYAIVAVIALILDQMVKYWATVNIVENTAGFIDAKPLIPSVLRLTKFHNTGAAFSFMANVSWARWFFVVLSVVFVAIVIYALVREIVTHPVARWAAVFVMTGAIGNCIDRALTGYVVDMLEFEFKILGRNFPVFNVADMYITLGAIVFAIVTMLDRSDRKPAPERASAPAAPAAPPAEGARSHVSVPERKPPEPAGPAQNAAFPPEDADEDGADAFGEWKPAESAALAARMESAASGPSKTERVMRTLVTGSAEQPAAAAPERRPAAPQAAAGEAAASAKPEPAPPPAPGTPAAEESYDLDDILAEFRDL